jgi:hypothetical protein
MKRFLIKIAYKILQYYSLETFPYLYCCDDEYEVISLEIHPDEWVRIYAERKR